MKILIVKEPIKMKELIEMGEEGFGEMVKAVVDVEKKFMTVGGKNCMRMEYSLNSCLNLDMMEWFQRQNGLGSLFDAG